MLVVSHDYDVIDKLTLRMTIVMCRILGGNIVVDRDNEVVLVACYRKLSNELKVTYSKSTFIPSAP